MFRKPFKVKSNIQLKNSDKKAFKSLILQNFPSVTENDIDFVVKESISTAKITTHSNDIVLVYLINKKPMFFIVKDNLYPTLFMLWQLPNLTSSLTTHSNVLEKIGSGADLMLPGVLTPETQNRYGSIELGSAVYINSICNKAAFAVGEALMSSNQMLYANDRGKCVRTLHTFGDHLCSMEGINIQMPKMGPVQWEIEDDQVKPVDEPIPSVEELKIFENSTTTDQNNQGSEENPSSEVANDNLTSAVIESSLDSDKLNENNLDDMNYLISYCFLKVLKESGKSLSLPVKFSNFNKTMLDACPTGKSLEIKKTKYKKVSVFLRQMEQDGFITCNEQPKGVENIVTINLAHPEVRRFVLLENDEKKAKQDDQTHPIVVSEACTVTAAVLPLFETFKYKKGDVVPMNSLRQHVTKYVKEKGLDDKPQKGLITPNEVLTAMLQSNKPLSWEDIMTKIKKLMGSCYSIKTLDGREVRGKGQVEHIVLSVATRSGNKKVTLIDNLELYGININNFAKECQHGIAASTSVSRPAGKKYDQLLVQGNQVRFVGELLQEKYKVPKKYISGLQLAPKRK